MADSKESKQTSAPKFSKDDPNRFLKPETAAKYKVVDWAGNEAMVFPTKE